MLPHGPVTVVAENVWRVDGTNEGMPLGRVMTIARRTDGSLVLHNVIALDDATMSEVERLGPIGTIVVPNGWHRLDAPAFESRYPSARILCPAGAKKRVSAVVEVDGAYEDLPPDEAVRLEPLEGLGGVEGVLQVRSADGVTLAFNDTIFNQPRLPGGFGFVYHHVIRSTGGPKVPPVARWFMVKDRRALRSHLERLAALPDLRRVIIMHGQSPESDPGGFLRTVAATLD